MKWYDKTLYDDPRISHVSVVRGWCVAMLTRALLGGVTWGVWTGMRWLMER